MPVDYEIDENRRLLITKGVGAITEAELLDCRDRVAADPRMRADFDQLGDYRAVTSTVAVTSEGVRRLASVSFLGAGSRRAYVAGSDGTFGLLRMFQVMRDGGPERIQVFRSLDDALMWLGRPPAEDGPPGDR